MEIDENDVGFVLPENFQKFLATRNDFDCIAFPFDDGLHQSSGCRIVLDIKNITACLVSILRHEVRVIQPPRGGQVKWCVVAPAQCWSSALRDCGGNYREGREKSNH